MTPPPSLPNFGEARLLTATMYIFATLHPPPVCAHDSGRKSEAPPPGNAIAVRVGGRCHPAGFRGREAGGGGGQGEGNREVSLLTSITSLPAALVAFQHGSRAMATEHAPPFGCHSTQQAVRGGGGHCGRPRVPGPPASVSAASSGSRAPSGGACGRAAGGPPPGFRRGRGQKSTSPDQTGSDRIQWSPQIGRFPSF